MSKLGGGHDYVTIESCVECGAKESLTGFLCHTCRVELGYEEEGVSL